MKKLTRKQFIQGTLAAGVGIGILASAGCSDSDSKPADGSTKKDGATDTTPQGDKGTGDTTPAGDRGIGDTTPHAPDTVFTPDTASGACGTTITNLILSSVGHTLSVPRADVAAGKEKEYNLQGTSTHPHFIILTAADFKKLQNGTPVTKTSFDKVQSGHDHDVTVTC